MTAATQTQVDDAEPTTRDRDEGQTAQALADLMTASGIRSWMSEEGLTRSRGARKLESARQAFGQDPALCHEKADELLDEHGAFKAHCPHCSFSERRGSAEAAEEAASAHKSDEPTHFPKAVDQTTGEALYG